MTNEAVKIKLPELAARPVDLAGWEALWSGAERCEVFNRYCDYKDREAKYRRRAQAKKLGIQAFLADHPEVAAEIEDSLL